MVTYLPTSFPLGEACTSAVGNLQLKELLVLEFKITKGRGNLPHGSVETGVLPQCDTSFSVDGSQKAIARSAPSMEIAVANGSVLSDMELEANGRMVLQPNFSS